MADLTLAVAGLALGTAIVLLCPGIHLVMVFPELRTTCLRNLQAVELPVPASLMYETQQAVSQHGLSCILVLGLSWLHRAPISRNDSSVSLSCQCTSSFTAWPVLYHGAGAAMATWGILLRGGQLNLPAMSLHSPIHTPISKTLRNKAAVSIIAQLFLPQASCSACSLRVISPAESSSTMAARLCSFFRLLLSLPSEGFVQAEGSDTSSL